MKMNRLAAIASLFLVAAVASAYTLKDTLNPVAIYTGSNATPTVNAASDGTVTLGPVAASNASVHSIYGNLTFLRGANDAAIGSNLYIGTGVFNLNRTDTTRSGAGIGFDLNTGGTAKAFSVFANLAGDGATTAATEIATATAPGAWTFGPSTPFSANKHTINGGILSIASGGGVGSYAASSVLSLGSNLYFENTGGGQQSSVTGTGGHSVIRVASSLVGSDSALEVRADRTTVSANASVTPTSVFAVTVDGAVHNQVTNADQGSIFSTDRSILGVNIYLNGATTLKSFANTAGYSYMQLDRGGSSANDAFKFIGNIDTQTNGLGGAPIVTNDKQLLRGTLGGTIFMGQYANGTVSFTGGTGQITSSSDRRLKTPTTGKMPGLREVSALKPVFFKWNNEINEKGIDKADTQLGFFAQDVLPVIPEAVGKPTEHNKYYGLYDRPLIAALVNAVKELKAENDGLKARLDAAGL